ncbi:antitoxin VbhA family protein [Cellulomonas sp. DKR-3]|uniref:Antitoxin VbhA family protein n=1 Tax=Cellulomonas fulva TaxID=2835530 RepID=A0ABS5TXP6_9CELL|nr:antitoxin VbhA family protein [Cellulomonas fulva]
MSTPDQAERARIAAGALASARLAGHEPDPELEAMCAAWVAGEITLDDLQTWIDQQYPTDSQETR